MARRCSTICLPIDKDDYPRFQTLEPHYGAS